MTQDIDKAIARAREIESKATDGYWRRHGQDIRRYYLDYDHRMAHASTSDNASLIVHARNTHKLVWDVIETWQQMYSRASYLDSEQKMRTAIDALARAVNGGE